MNAERSRFPRTFELIENFVAISVFIQRTLEAVHFVLQTFVRCGQASKRTFETVVVRPCSTADAWLVAVPTVSERSVIVGIASVPRLPR
jgi:hypothetical protein